METKPSSLSPTSVFGVSPPDDASHLLTVFPEEVWRLALGNVDNASDYFKICGASPAFHEWLSGHRVHVLLGPVIKILIEEKYEFLTYRETDALDKPSSKDDAAETSDSEEEEEGGAQESDEEGGAEESDEEGGSVESESEEEDGDSESDEEESESDSEEKPEETAYIRESRYLATFRLVCRSWKASVDRYLQEIFTKDRFITTEYGFLKPYHIRNFFRKTFYSAACFQEFASHFLSTHFTSGANPFPARKVDINFLGNSINELFYNSCRHMLRHYGRHIDYLFLEVDIQEPLEQFGFYLQLKEMLSLLPSLKILGCNFKYQARVLDEFQVYQLVSIYRDAILPPGLHSLMMEGTYPLRVLKQLLLRAPSSLNYLHAKVHKQNHFPLILVNGQVRLPLTKLWLSMPPQSPEFREDVFTAVETLCGDTLIDLRLDLPNANCWEGVSLKLSKLKTLILQHCLSAGSLDFLWGVASTLETLEVNLIKIRGEELRTVDLLSILKLISHRKELVKSNVWQLLPRLQSVMINERGYGVWDKRVCTRAEWESSMNQQQQ